MPHPPAKPTPFFDAWRDTLRQATAKRGRKTALATHMAAIRRQSVPVWRTSISRILRGGTLLNAEDLLAMDAWIRHNSPR